MTSPASGRSSRPARCSSVDLPAPDGATSATDLARRRARGRRRAGPRAARRPAPIAALDASSRRAPGRRPRRTSFIAQRLDRIEPGRAPGRDRASPASDRTSAISDDRRRPRVGSISRGQLRQEIELGREQIGAGEPGADLADRLDVDGDERAPSARPTSVPTTPIAAPVMRKMRMIAPRVAPIVRRMAMSRALSFTSMIRPEMMLSAATSTISVRMTNITLRSTASASKKVRLRWRQSVSRSSAARPPPRSPGAHRVDVVGIVDDRPRSRSPRRRG